MASTTRTTLSCSCSCVLLRADAAVTALRATFTTPLPLQRVQSALPCTLGDLPCFSARKGIRSWRVISTLSRGAANGVVAAPVPLVSALQPAASSLRHCC
jgi:hypothetical protein